MTTTKNRINVSFTDAEERALRRISKRDQLPVATKVAQMVRFALDIEEDMHFSRLGDAIITNDTRPAIPHNRAWK